MSLRRISFGMAAEPRRARPKYGNRRTEVDGIKFASLREARRYKQLKLLESAGRIRNIATQVSYRLEIAGKLICRYVADFTYEELDRGAWYPVTDDAKGFKTPEYKLKKKLMAAIHGIEIRES